jgi:hypothetical protein
LVETDITIGAPLLGCRKAPVWKGGFSQATNGRRQEAASFGRPGRFMGVLAPKLVTFSAGHGDGDERHPD